MNPGNIMVSDEIHAKLITIQQEMEREYIMISLQASTADNISDMLGVGYQTVSPARDKRAMEIIQEKIRKMDKLLSYPRDQITRKRMAALRQHYFMLEFQNRRHRRGRNKNWTERSAKFVAGKFLTGIFDKHISYEDRK
jgi:hypothetical protein